MTLTKQQAAVIKGLVEFRDRRRYFGSTLALSTYVEECGELGLVTISSDRLKVNVTAAGFDAYFYFALYLFPQWKTAVYWDQDLWADCVDYGRTA